MELSETYVRAIVHLALEEDIGAGDITSHAVVDRTLRGRAALWTRQPLVVAGLQIFCQVFHELDGSARVALLANDGDEVAANTCLAETIGPVRSLLAAERVALNFLQRLCGIATLTRSYVRAANNPHVRVLDTRKTTPLLRVLEKYAVRIGGGGNHRLGLDDGYLIKENHIRMAGGIAAALDRAFDKAAAQLIEIEVTSEEELQLALLSGARWILLDNMTLDQVRRCVEINGGRARLEVSGRVSLDNIAQYAACGVDDISIGALTHSAPAADLTLLFSDE